MDKAFKEFLLISYFTVILFFLALVSFWYIYNFSSINTYNIILLILVVLTIIIIVFLVLMISAVFYAYKRRYVNASSAWFIKIALNFLFPVVTLIWGLFNGSKDTIRNIAIDINNILVESGSVRFFAEDILLLLPHCLQNADCIYKITNDINNCRRCGKCCIGDIIEVGKAAGVKTRVVTGGTAARNIVSESRPKLILSVACERDLASGINDVKDIPVIGIKNDRPNGPCYNTYVDAQKLKEKLQSVIK